MLRDYQAQGVAFMLGQSGACMGDDMGLGKSRQTVVACRLAAGKQRVLIVCPASLRLNWEREIKMVYPDAIVGMLGDDRMATLHGCDWVIGNYERMGGWCVRSTCSSRYKVFIGTTMAAGVGTTLTAANIVAFASMPWTPALMRQAEDRACRLGQKRDVLVLVPVIPGTIDEGVLALQENKRTTEEEVIEAAKMGLPAEQRALGERAEGGD